MKPKIYFILIVVLLMSFAASAQIPWNAAITKDSLNKIAKQIKSTQSENYDFFSDNAVQIDSLMGKGYATRIMQQTIYQEFIQPEIANLTSVPQWTSIERQLKRYGRLSTKPILLGKFNYYKGKENWVEFIKAAKKVYRKYPEAVPVFLKNNINWRIFETSDDEKILNNALQWSKEVITKDPAMPTYWDTYANLFYRLGDVKNALIYEQKAIELAPVNEKQPYQDLLDKMKENIPTWPVGLSKDL